MSGEDPVAPAPTEALSDEPPRGHRRRHRVRTRGRRRAGRWPRPACLPVIFLPPDRLATLSRSGTGLRRRRFETMTTHRDGAPPADAKQAILDYCLRKGALAAGVADLEAIERIAPAGHRPSDLMPRVRSVISLGVGGQTRARGRCRPRPWPTSAAPRPAPAPSPTAARSSSRADSAPGRSTARPTSTTSPGRGCRRRA